MFCLQRTINPPPRLQMLRSSQRLIRSSNQSYLIWQGRHTKHRHQRRKGIQDILQDLVTRTSNRHTSAQTRQVKIGRTAIVQSLSHRSGFVQFFTLPGVVVSTNHRPPYLLNSSSPKTQSGENPTKPTQNQFTSSSPRYPIKHDSHISEQIMVKSK